MYKTRLTLYWQLLLIACPALAVLLLFLISTYCFFIPTVGKSFYSQKREMVKHLTQVMISSMESRNREVIEGRITLEEAQDRAKRRLRGLRYGSNSKDYYWIIDSNGKMIVHPYRTDLEGKELRDFADVTGYKLFAEMITLSEEKGGGYVEYYWQWMDDPSRTEKKISYVMAYKPWGWIIGTGVYVDDIERSLADLDRKVALTGVVISVLAGGLAFLLAWKAYSSARSSIRATEMLRQSEENVRVTLSSIGDAVIATDIDGRVTRINPAAETLTGWDAKEALGKHLPEVFHIVNAKTRQRCENPAEIVLRTNAKVGLANHTMLLSREGNEYQIADSGAPIRNNFGETIGVVLVFRNITEAYRLQEELRDSEERFRAIFDHANDAIMVLQGDTFVECNEMTLSMFGCSREQFVGSTPHRFSPPVQRDGKSSKDKAKMMIAQALQGKLHAFDWTHIRQDGSPFEVEVSLSSIVLHGEPHIVAMVRDVTERNMLEERLRQSEKMDAIGQLAGGVAHDFNNMLGGIMGAGEMLQAKLKDDPPAQKYIRLLLETAERAGELTGKLLAFSRKGLQANMPLDLHAAILDAVALLSSSVDKKVEIETRLNSPHSYIVGDPPQIQNIFLNLGINSAHAMPDGGKLEFTTRLRTITEADSSYSPELVPGSYIEAEVVDTGCGIAPSDLPHIFEPFFTTKTAGKGTGLGLAAVYGTVQRHHGYISVSSENRQGTTFIIGLPLYGGSAEKSVPSLHIRGEGRILLVDDEPVIRSTIAALLENLGYEMETAKDGREAMEILFRENGRMDLVILDMQMPNMNGRECFAAIRENWPEMKIIISSGYAENTEIDLLKLQGQCEFLRKPYRGADLSSLVAKVMKQL
jgi:PAS domain S-box-containing protein